METHRQQLEVIKVGVCAVARALEGLVDAQPSEADAVGNVDDAGKLLELPEKRLRDERVVGGAMMSVTGRNSCDEEHKTGEEQQAEQGGHGGLCCGDYGALDMMNSVMERACRCEYTIQI